MSETTHKTRRVNNVIYLHLAVGVAAMTVTLGILNTVYGFITNFTVNLLLTFLGMTIVYWALQRSKAEKKRNQ